MSSVALFISLNQGKVARKTMGLWYDSETLHPQGLEEHGEAFGAQLTPWHTRRGMAIGRLVMYLSAFSATVIRPSLVSFVCKRGYLSCQGGRCFSCQGGRSFSCQGGRCGRSTPRHGNITPAHGPHALSKHTPLPSPFPFPSLLSTSDSGHSFVRSRHSLPPATYDPPCTTSLHRLHLSFDLSQSRSLLPTATF
jgi:hypothetical protein